MTTEPPAYKLATWPARPAIAPARPATPCDLRQAQTKIAKEIAQQAENIDRMLETRGRLPTAPPGGVAGQGIRRKPLTPPPKLEEERPQTWWEEKWRPRATAA